MNPGNRPAASRLVVVAVLVIAAGAAAAWWYKSRPTSTSAIAQAESQPVMELAPAEVATATRKALVRRLPVSGTVTSMLKTTVRSRVSGEVLEVMFREGERVAAGAALARIDTRSLEAQVASARAARDKASADLEISRLNYENSKRLFQKKVLAQNELDTRKSLYDAAIASQKLAVAQLRLVEIDLQDAVVRAPFDAVIARRFQHPGGRVSPDAPLFELVDLTHMELQAAAPAAEIPVVKPGQRASLRVDGYGGEEFSATLQRVSPAAEQGSRLVLLYLTLDNVDGRLRDGMFAQGALLIEQGEPAIAVPSAAIINEAGLDYVMVIEDGRVQRRPVTLGLVATQDRMVEIRSGLAEGEKLLAVRIGSLDPGTPIQLPASGPAGALD